MKARIKSNGKIVEVVSRFMPKKRNVPSRDWVCNLSDGTCIDENQLEYIDAPEGLEEAAEEYRRESFKKSVIPQIDGPVNEYGGNIKSAFIAGAEWQKEQDQPITGNSLEQEWLRYVDRKKKECRGELPSLGEYGWLQIARHFAEWQESQMLKDAVEGEVIVPIYEGDDTWSAEIKIPGRYGIGDKVRIIVVKAEEEE